MRARLTAKFPALNDWWNCAMARPAASTSTETGTEGTPKWPATKSIAGIAEYRV